MMMLTLISISRNCLYLQSRIHETGQLYNIHITYNIMHRHLFNAVYLIYNYVNYLMIKHKHESKGYP